MSLLRVDGLTIGYPGQPRPVVDGLTFSLEEGESVALAGASGSGKTQTALGIMRLLSRDARVGGSVRLGDSDILNASAAEMRGLRARRIAMVFQDPAAALNPYRRVGDQLRTILEQHGLGRGRSARRSVVDMLARTGLPDPERQAGRFPFELSGGMRQRVLIASALIARPQLLIADEPTTALDVTVQAQILELLRDLREETGVALLLITHDFGVIAAAARRMLVLDQGRLVESGSTADVFAEPAHARTRSMLDAARRGPCLVGDLDRQAGAPVLDADSVSVVYPERTPGPVWRRRGVTAVQPMSFALRAGETLALVGESGSGKSSLARAVLGLLPAGSGRVVLLGRELPSKLGRRQLEDLANLQLVFQDPAGSFDPALRLAASLAEPLRVHEPSLSRADCRRRIEEAVLGVGLEAGLLERYPHQLSGGQAQRAAIARALILKPAVLVCDEAVASVDAPVRRDLLERLAGEQRANGLSILFISHDLEVVRQLSHSVLVLYMGHVVEQGSRGAVFRQPRHPYTRALIDAAPVADPDAARTRPVLGGEPASILNPPGGCVFHPRCAHAIDRCRIEPPGTVRLAGVDVKCHRAAELDLSTA